ncbi:MAG: 2-amino-4-hydroxy-6-hydroxymethyldihydropteridine diphosphokinase [Candidatus Acidiferrales bacterium]
MAKVYLSLGSNLGDRAQNIARSIEALAARGIRLMKQSSLYETEPVELRAQEWFLNSVIEVETNKTPQELMHQVLEIERGMGRIRTAPKGPRIIDMDILLYGLRTVREPNLEIPHPRMADRRFVLVPFAEIAPDAVHPTYKKTIAELLAETPDSSEVRMW